MATPQQPETPFARALQQWVADLKRDEDKKSTFYKEVLSVQNAISSESRGSDECAKGAAGLANFIRDLEKKRRAESKSTGVATKLRPFVENLTKVMGLLSTVIQAAPFEVGIAFTGAQLVLHLATKHATTFDKMVDIMGEISVHLKCYDGLSAVYEGSDDIQEELLSAYKTIINFWKRASQVLSQRCLSTLV